jgi:hypothetical protein
MRRLIVLALASGAFAGTAPAQTSVDIHTGANGQLSGSATAGGASSHVETGDFNGNPVRDGPWTGQGARSEAHCTGNGRTVTVTSPNGSSSSSVSTSDGGTATVAGGGSPGSRVRYGDCDRPATAAYRGPHGDGAYASSSAGTGPGVAVRHTTRHAVRHHRRRNARRR